MNILVTGGTGYIGRHLVKRLVALGHDVSAVVREGSSAEVLNGIPIHRYSGQLDDLVHAVEISKPGVVFHVASLFLVQHKAEDVGRLIASNILFPAQLLEAMSNAGVKKIVNVGTSWQHFRNEPYSPVNLYAATKQAFEDLLAFYTDAHGFKAITLKLFDTYGPGDTRPKLFSLLRRTARSSTPLKMSPGLQPIDVVYIDDVIDAFVTAMHRLPEMERPETYGVRTGTPIALRDLVAVYAEVIGRDVPVEWGGLPYRPREVMTLWSDAQCLPGWTAHVSLREGIAQMERDPDIGGVLAVQKAL